MSNNDLSKTNSCYSEGSGAALNSLNMNIRGAGSRGPEESDENDPMVGFSLDSQVSCIDNTGVDGHDGGCYPERNIPPGYDTRDYAVCLKIIPNDEVDQYGPDRNSAPSPSRAGAIRAHKGPPKPPNMAHAGEGFGGARPKDIAPPHPKDRYEKYADYQAKILSCSVRMHLARSMNYKIESMCEAGFPKNWEGLAELMGKDSSYVHTMDSREKDPTGALLKDWQTERGSTIGKLVEYLWTLDRYDILDDDTFFRLIERSVDDEKGRVEIAEGIFEQQFSKNKPETPKFTIRDVEEKTTTFYNAFVCYEEGDEPFVMEMIKELEMRDGHKLCLNARDLLIGQNEQIVTAELIKSRCEKTIVVLSPEFVREDSEMCQFAMHVSLSLNPAARKSKIVPVMVDECEIPPSLYHITPVDFTRSLQRVWQWRKVSACLKTCHELLSYKEKASLRGITLRAPHRSVDLRASVRASMRKAETDVLAAGTVIIPVDTTDKKEKKKKKKNKKKRQEEDAASMDGKSPTSPIESADDDNVDGIAKTVNEEDKKKDRAREKKKNETDVLAAGTVIIPADTTDKKEKNNNKKNKKKRQEEDAASLDGKSPTSYSERADDDNVDGIAKTVNKKDKIKERRPFISLSFFVPHSKYFMFWKGGNSSKEEK